MRVSKAKSRDYVVIVRGYRDQHGKPRQKTIKNLGSFKNEDEKKRLYEIGTKLIASMEGQHIIDANADITELSRSNWGGGATVDALLAKFKINEKIDELVSGRKLKFDLSKTIKFLLISRLLDPQSKLGAYHDRDFLLQGSDIALHHLYRALDELALYKNELSQHIFEKQKKLSGQIDVVLFDVTTMYFESKNADELRDFGFSKDCKFGEVQVVMSMIVGLDGRPLGFELFPGNTFEGNTMLEALTSLKQKYKIKKVTIVADRGMSLFNNLQSIKDAGFEYVVAFRIRNASKALQKEILDNAGYSKKEVENSEETLMYKGLALENGNLLCTYSSKRAKKDEADREKLLEKAKILLENGGYKRKNGAKKYLKIEENATEILHDKVAEDARYDGYYAISYSDKNSAPDEVLSAYHGLWRIEESFRSMKNFLQTRPMFHWTKDRIIGHVMLNYIALVFEKEMELLTGLPQEQIRKELYSMQSSEIRIGGAKSRCYSAVSKLGELILTKLNISRQ